VQISELRKLKVAILRDLIKRGWRPPEKVEIDNEKAMRIIEDILRFNEGMRHISSLELSNREHLILTYVAEGLTEPEIAKQLHVSHESVHSMMRAVRRKLGVRSSAHAVAEGFRKGILE
jgi:DNA-binding NarL/FixJ family response regulator